MKKVLKAASVAVAASVCFTGVQAHAAYAPTSGLVQGSESLMMQLYSEGFENFTPGVIDGQFGWTSANDGMFADVFAPATGVGHATVSGTGSGGFETNGASPGFVDGGSGDIITTAMNVKLDGSDTTFFITPVSFGQGFINTRVQINADGSVEVLDIDPNTNTGVFVDAGLTIVNDYVNLAIAVERATGLATISFDGVDVLTVQGLATLTDAILFESFNEGATTSFLDIDDIEVFTSGGAAPVPVPAAAPLFAAGMAIAALRRRKKSA